MRLCLALHIHSVLGMQVLDLLRMACPDPLPCELVLPSCLVARLSEASCS